MTRICNQTYAGVGAAARSMLIRILRGECELYIGIAAACRPKLGATPDYLDRIISHLPYRIRAKLTIVLRVRSARTKESYNAHFPVLLFPKHRGSH